jgi:hypothetical protein
VLKVLLILVILGVLSVWLYIKSKGDCRFEFLVAERTAFVPVETRENYVVFSCQVPFVNSGAQDGTLIDVHLRTLLPKEYYDKVDVDGRMHNASDPRGDHYWESVIIPYGTGGTAVLNIKLTATSGDIRADLAEMVDMPMYIVYEVVGRRPIVVYKAYLVMTQEETRAVLEQVT